MSRFNGVFSRNNSPRIEDITCVIFSGQKSKGSHLVSSFIGRNTWFFETENIPEEVLIEIRDKSVTYNKIRI